VWKKYDEAHGNFLPGNAGVSIMKNGFLFIALIWTMGFISVTDRKMFKAGCIWSVAAALACFGVIHSNKLGFPQGSTGTGTAENDVGGGSYFIGAYLLMAGFCFFIYALQWFGLTNGPICRSDGTEVWNRPAPDEGASVVGSDYYAEQVDNTEGSSSNQQPLQEAEPVIANGSAPNLTVV